MHTRRPCSICRSHDAELLHTIRYPNDKERILPVEYRIVACSSCGMVFDDFDADESVFIRHYQCDGKYEMLESNGAGGLNTSSMVRWEQIAERLAPFISPDDFIADIGSGKGGLLKFLWDRGYRNLTAIDSSANCIDYIRKNYEFSAHCCNFSSYDRSEKFDIIILAQTLEHIFDCRSCLEKISGMLKENGILYLDVPDAGRYAAFKKLPFYYFDHEHINHFQMHSLQNLLTVMGFEILAAEQFEASTEAGFTNPLLAVTAKKSSTTEPVISKNDISPLKEYVSISAREDKKLTSISPKKNAGYIWGVGALCQRLLFDGVFDNINLRGLIDLDRKKQGTEVSGLKISAPEILLNSDTENLFVIISTALYEDAIRKQLKEMGFKGEILTLE